jgi:hypothetical protein
MSGSTTAGPGPAEPGAAIEDAAIRPFRVEVPEADLVELFSSEVRAAFRSLR